MEKNIGDLQRLSWQNRVEAWISTKYAGIKKTEVLENTEEVRVPYKISRK